MNSVYKIGYRDAFHQLGLEKIAVSVGTGAPMLRRLKWWLQKKMPTKSGLRQFAVGDPRRFGSELMRGKAFGKGSLVRQGFHAPDAFSKVMFYGFPAVEAGSVALDEEGDKAKRIGQTLGGAALGLAAWRPLGMVGSMAADVLGRRLGGAVGQTASHLVGGQKSPTLPDTEAFDPYSGATQAGRAAGAISRVPHLPSSRGY